jgi:hypothetical protein
MDGATEPSDATAGDDVPVVGLGALPSISRRRFNTLIGAGSAAALGAGFVAPHISTIKFARKAAVGSPPPGSTTTTTIGPTGTTTPNQGNGRLSISNHAPCAGNAIGVIATGFAPKTAVSLQIDSPAYPLGVVTADASGGVNTVVQLPANAPLGPHKLVAAGVQLGGKSLTLTAPVNIKTQGNCDTGTGSQGSNDGSNGSNGDGSSVDVSGDTGHQSTSNGSGSLAFTGTDSTRLALLGAGAAVIGRVVYGAANAGRDEDQEDAPDA